MKSLTHKLTSLTILATSLLVPVAVRAQTLQTWDTCSIDGVPTLKCIEVVYGNFLTISSGLVLLILFCLFIYAGFTYLSSFGDAKKVESAQNTLKWAIIGTVIFALSFLILKIIDALFLGGAGTIFNLNIPGPTPGP